MSALGINAYQGAVCLAPDEPSHYPPSAIIILFAAILLPAICRGAITWDTQRIELTTKPSDKEAVGLFHFVNSGNSTVTITSVQPSCGCTTAELGKRTYGPGEAGEIKAVFTLGDRVGEQEKIIYVATDDDSAQSVPLVLHVMIPELLSYLPRLLMWNVGDKLDEKATTLTANGPLRISTIEVSSPVPAEVTVRTEPVETGVSYQLFVRPVSSSNVMNVPIAGVATFTDGTTQPFMIYALMR